MVGSMVSPKPRSAAGVGSLLELDLLELDLPLDLLDFSELDGFQGMTPVNTAQRPIVTFPSDDGSEYPYLDNILFSASVECCWAKPYVQTVSDHIMLMAEVTVENPEV